MGYGCAALPGYTKSVLTTTKSGVNHDPFGGSTTSMSTSMSTTASSSATTSATTSASATIPNPSHSSPASVSSSPVTASSQSSLSAGAIGGIVAGGAVAIALLLALAWCLFRRRRRDRKLRQSTLPYRTSDPDEMSYSTGQKPEQGQYSWPMSPAGYFHTRPKSLSTVDRTSTAPSEYGQPFSPASGRQGQTTSDTPYSGPTIPELMDTEPSQFSSHGPSHSLS